VVGPELPSAAERNAARAADFEAFGGINLVHVRRQLSSLLELIGTDGIFDEYTKHDIRHIDGMLNSLDWIIPQETKEIMTTGDWLLTVLGIYFHDLGMLVTKDEYRARQHSGFERFKQEVLITDNDDGKEYAARLEELDSKGVDIERLQYQEFVRYHHARRIKKWITGEVDQEFGDSGAARTLVTEIVEKLGDTFRDDLAMVCESHHLDDLYDTEKYSVSNPYGLHSEECANVQYAAVLLRTADLLHITKDRTPSIAYRMITPSDPVSQFEWAKQASVRNVRDKIAIDGDGKADPAAPRNTVEVYADFTNGDAFFGLTSYLSYAEQQLIESRKWILESNERLASPHKFPWRSIDTKKVKAKGFLPEQFHFSLDDKKVLDLLTGHTLYSDSRVVLRELLQNSIDAVRLQHGTDSATNGHVWVKWDSNSRVMEVGDNGTGMTQSIIVNNLLKAGSSRYQEPDFKKEHPDFTPISRFGIGVMSTFMIADKVEVLTSHPVEEKSRHLSLRSAHGKYLVRLLDKHELPDEIKEHGTIVRLHVRPSVEADTIISAAHSWIVVPNCKVSTYVDENEPEHIGHVDLKSALTHALIANDATREEEFAAGTIKVEEKTLDGVSMAYALEWDDYFKHWGFIGLPSLTFINLDEDFEDNQPFYAVGTCVEGIRVETTSPGFRDDDGIWACINAFGKSAPRTDVARRTLEATEERQALIAKAYELYCAHVSSEIDELESERGQSMTYAVQEAGFLATALHSSRSASSPALLFESLKDLPLFLGEEQSGERKKYTARELDQFTALHIRESNVSHYAEFLLRDIPQATSKIALLEVLGQPAQPIESNELMLCSALTSSDIANEFIWSSWQVASLYGNLDRRLFDVKLIQGVTGNWSPIFVPPKYNTELRKFEDRRTPTALSRIPISGVESGGFPDEIVGVVLSRRMHLLPNHPWAQMVDSYRDEEGKLDPFDRRLICLSWLITQAWSNGSFGKFASGRAFQEQVKSMVRSALFADFDSDLFQEILRASSDKKLMDTRFWNRAND